MSMIIAPGQIKFEMTTVTERARRIEFDIISKIVAEKNLIDLLCIRAAYMIFFFLLRNFIVPAAGREK